MKIKIVLVFLILVIIIDVFTGCFDSESTIALTTDDIIDKFIQAANTVTSYSYKGISNTIYNSTINGTKSTVMSGELSIMCKTDIINKKMGINITSDIEYMVESLENYSGEYDENYYYENDSFYTSWIGNNTWHPWVGDDQWYYYAILESQSNFIVQNSTFKKMDDEVIDGIECYVLSLDTPPEALFLEFYSTSFVFSQGAYPDRYLEIVIKYWISKDNNLLKKAYFKTLVNSTGFISHIPGDNQISLKELDVSFYDYNQPLIIQSPWKSFLDEVDKNLSHLKYVNNHSGFGLNPPKGFYFDELSNEYHIDFHLGGTDDDYNASFTIRPPIKESGGDNQNNLSFEVSRILDYYYNNASKDNASLISHSEISLNGMDAHEFIAIWHPSFWDKPKKFKAVYVEKGDRLFELEYRACIEYFETYEEVVNETINSFMIISPYFYII